MKVKEFVERFIEHNTLVRLWYKLPKGSVGIHEQVMDGGKLMMEHELVKSEYNDREVVGVTDILVDRYCEAVNLIIKKRDIKEHRIESIGKLTDNGNNNR